MTALHRCARCGDRFFGTVDARYCPPCSQETKALIAADAKRRVVRFGVAKELAA